MIMVPNRHDYVCDWFHSLGTYWVVDKGLYREDINSNVDDFLFPKLHKIRDKTIAKNLTNLIRENLPASTPEKIKRGFTSRSIRKGGISELAMNRDVNQYSANVRSGHSLGTNQESYIDRKSVALSLLGGMALNDWDDVNGRPYPPRLSCLGELSREHIERMIEKLYVISHPYFLPDGPLRPVLRTTFASLLMYYRASERDLGDRHILILHIRNAAIDLNIQDTDTNTPVDVLRLWSKRIYNDFLERNRLGSVEKESDMLPAVQSMCKMMTTMQESIKEMKLLQRDHIGLIESLKQHVQEISARNEKLQSDHNIMKRKMKFIRTPPSIESSIQSPYDESTVGSTPLKRQCIVRQKLDMPVVTQATTSNALVSLGQTPKTVIPLSQATLSSTKGKYYISLFYIFSII